MYSMPPYVVNYCCSDMMSPRAGVDHEHCTPIHRIPATNVDITPFLQELQHLCHLSVFHTSVDIHAQRLRWGCHHALSAGVPCRPCLGGGLDGRYISHTYRLGVTCGAPVGVAADAGQARDARGPSSQRGAPLLTCAEHRRAQSRSDERPGSGRRGWENVRRILRERRCGEGWTW